MPEVDLKLFAPELIITLTGLGVLILDLFWEKEKNKYLVGLSIFGLFLALVFSLGLIGKNGTTLGGLFTLDAFSLFFKILFLLIAFLVILLSVNTFTRPDLNPGEYYTLLLFAVLGMMLISSTTDFVMIYLALELISISSYVLAGYRRFDPKSNEAALKYFILGLVASAIMLYGISFIYGFTGFTQLADIAQRISPQTGRLVVIMGVIFTLSGFSFKMAAVPFHQWVPDVYEGAPTPITAFFSVGPKIAAVAALLRILLVGFPDFIDYWQTLFIILSVLSMFLGNLLAIPQTNIKRMLAFSTIAHAGYILMGIAVASKLAITGVLVYVVVYTFMNLGAFGVVVALSHTAPATEISDYAGLNKRSPFLAFTMAIFLVSLAGIPPTAGLWGKFLVFAAAVEANLAWFALLGLLNTVISLYYYANVIRHMYLMEPARTEKVKVFLPLRGALWITFLGTVILGILPQPLINISNLSSLLGG